VNARIESKYIVTSEWQSLFCERAPPFRYETLQTTTLSHNFH